MVGWMVDERGIEHVNLIDKAERTDGTRSDFAFDPETTFMSAQVAKR
jgi:hypothetical protein